MSKACRHEFSMYADNLWSGSQESTNRAEVFFPLHIKACKY